MTDIDAALARMAAEPVPAGLEAIDAGVLARIAGRPARGTGIGLLAVIAAAGLGVFGAGAGSMPVRAAVPFGMESVPAPSLLLDGGA